MRRWQMELDELRVHREMSHMQRVLRPLDRCAKVVTHRGTPLINLASNDYLGFASHPKMIEAVSAAVHEYGAGSGASQLITGYVELFEALSIEFARFKHAESALFCATGYLANLGVLTSLARPSDTIFIDKLNHASIIDGARLSGATVRTFPHLGYDKLQRLLERSFHDSPNARRLIVTDSVFSMDGDVADLPKLCELRDQYEAILVIDEAHGTGVLGETGSGLAEHQGVLGEIDITVSTCGKALGVLGGVVTGKEVVIDHLVNHARSYIYATGAMPAQAAGVLASLQLIQDEPEIRRQLAGLSVYLRSELRKRGWEISNDPTPIVPLIVGDAEAALKLSERVENEGFLIPAIRPPTVPAGRARLRISLRADVTIEEIDRLVGVIGDFEGG